MIPSEFDLDDLCEQIIEHVGVELARIPDPGCGYQCGRAHPSWVVVLHVPGFAALHAMVHDGAHLDISGGPLIPAGTQPSRAQVHALLHSDPGHDLAGNAPARRGTP